MSFNVRVSVKRVQVIAGPGADTVLLNTNLGSPMPNLTKAGLGLEFKAAKGQGVKYAFDSFPELLEVEYIDPQGIDTLQTLKRGESPKFKSKGHL